MESQSNQLSGIDIEGKDIEKVLGELGLSVTYIKGSNAPQLFRFDFIVNSTPTINTIKKTVERLRVHYGDYQYSDTPTGKGFSIIRPRKYPSAVYLADAHQTITETVNADENGKQKCYMCFGKDTSGDYIIRNIENYRSMLVAGSAGSGKSCFLNSLIMQILLYSNASLMLIDPKGGAEFNLYEDDIHYRINHISTDAEDAIKCLQTAVDFMEERYIEMGKKRIKTYDGKRIIIVIDELADLMMMSKSEVEQYIVRIAQKGRAAGIHLVVATQDPRAQVITGLIKYNLQTKICLKAQNARHSMNIMDKGDGANLLGRGDAYLKFEDTPEFVRVQTPYITDEQIQMLITR